MKIKFLDKVISQHAAYNRKAKNKCKNLNIFFTSYYTIYPLVYNAIITNSGCAADKEADPIFFKNYLEVNNCITLIYQFQKQFIDVLEISNYIRKYYLEKWKSYAIDVGVTLEDKSHSQLGSDLMQEIRDAQRRLYKRENFQAYRYFFLTEEELNQQIEIFLSNTLRNIKVINFESLSELKILLMDIPITYKDSYSNLGLVVFDAFNIINNLTISKYDDKSILSNDLDDTKAMINMKKRLNKTIGNANQETIEESIDFYHDICFMINNFRDKLDLNIIQIIYDYEKIKFYNQINYLTGKYNKKLSELDSFDEIKGVYIKITGSIYMIYRYPYSKTINGLEVVGSESQFSGEKNNYFAIIYMSDLKEYTFSLFRLEENCSITPITEQTKPIFFKDKKKGKSEEF